MKDDSNSSHAATTHTATTASTISVSAAIPEDEFDPSAPVLAEVVRMAQAIEAWRVQQSPAISIASATSFRLCNRGNGLMLT